MKIKLDENVHGDVLPALVDQGHDVQTAHEEGLAGRPDSDLAAAAKAEQRCLLTFDLDFSDPRKFPPPEFRGLVVLRLRLPTARVQVERITRFLAQNPDLAGKLWIVEENQARDWTP